MVSGYLKHITGALDWRAWSLPMHIAAGMGAGILLEVMTGGTMSGLYHSLLFVLLLLVSLYDLRDRIIPNRILAVGLGITLVFLWLDEGRWSAALPAAAGVTVLLLGIRWGSSACFNHPGIGMGDVKLLLLIALFVGWEIYWILYLAFMSAGIVAAAGLLTGWMDRKTRVPFAPFITLAVAAGLFWLPWNLVEGWLV